jgi:nucleoside-diphosphate-sugar epimerase
MIVAVTGATGFLGRYLVARLAGRGDRLRLWHRPASDRTGFERWAGEIEWVEGGLRDPDSAARLVEGADAVVHAALDRPGAGFRGAEGDLLDFVGANVLGTLRLIEAARSAAVGRFGVISTCAVHEVILDDRPLDEAHPAWPLSHYGAHKAAIEAFISSFGRGEGYPICALRPTGIYGLDHPPESSKWYALVAKVARGEDVTCTSGGKEVHAADVAKAAALLLDAPAGRISGEAFNCYDRYISDFEVATLARQLAGARGAVAGEPRSPKHEIETAKLRALGGEFGGRPLLERTVAELVDAARRFA